MNKHKEWTNEEDLLLSDLYQKLPVQKIAEKLNRSVGAIQSRAILLFLPRPKNYYKVYRNNELVAEGYRHEVAADLNIRHETLGTYVARGKKRQGSCVKTYATATKVGYGGNTA